MTRDIKWSREVRTDVQQAAFEAIDSEIEWIAHAVGGRGVHYPALISRATLERAGYMESFPHLLLSATRLDGETPWCLSPAVCYHTYEQLSGTVLKDPVAITAKGLCFRGEQETSFGVRQVEFEMREVVFLGEQKWVETQSRVAVERLTSLARRIGLQGDWYPAQDPFFLPTGEGKALMQRMLGVKEEYRTGGEEGLALASVNRHGTFFGDRFDIRHATNGQPAHSACVAVGLDRWYASLKAAVNRREGHDIHASAPA